MSKIFFYCSSIGYLNVSPSDQKSSEHEHCLQDGVFKIAKAINKYANDGKMIMKIGEYILDTFFFLLGIKS